MARARQPCARFRRPSPRGLRAIHPRVFGRNARRRRRRNSRHQLLPHQEPRRHGTRRAILTDSPECDAHARVLRNSGQTARYRHDELGYNSHLDELHAAILSAPSCPSSPDGPRAAAPSPPATAPASKARASYASMRRPARPPSTISSPALVTRGDKPAFLAYMRARGILCGEHYPILIPDQTCPAAAFRHEIATPLDRARHIAQREVSLPAHPYLTDEEVDNVIDACNQWERITAPPRGVAACADPCRRPGHAPPPPHRTHSQGPARCRRPTLHLASTAPAPPSRHPPRGAGRGLSWRDAARLPGRWRVPRHARRLFL